MLVWSSAYETGIARLDQDHRRLVEILNALEHEIEKGRGSSHVSGVLAELERYALLHFRREEGCMRKLGCPHARANEKAHATFQASLRDARQRLRSVAAGAHVARAIHHELSNWVVQHILSVDVVGIKACPSSLIAELKREF